MQDFIVDPGSDREAEEVAGRNAGLPRESAALLFRPSATLEPFERVMIYRGQYLMRMVEALSSDYPGAQAFLGEERFAALVSEYVQAFPSRSYTLNRLGDHFLEFVSDCAGVPRSAVGARVRLPRGQALSDLIRLELAMCRVFDEVETPAIGPEEISSRPPERWGEARLLPVAALRLVQLSYPVSDFLEALLAERSFKGALRRKASWVVVYRRNFSMYRLELDKPAYLLLRELLAERSLEEALDSVLRQARGITPDKLFRWFSRWMGEGFFRAVR
jgi:hypothetical protein